MSLGSDARRAVHASLREPRCTWRCRNRARAPASVTLEGNECDRVPNALASEAAVHSPLRVLRPTEMSVSGIRSHLRSPSCARIATLSLACFWRCGNRAIALLRVWLNGDECVRVPIIASCARVELGELGVAATVPVSLGSDDSRAVHASLREPRCTWRCRNRATEPLRV